MFAAESTDGLCESAGEVEGGESNSVPVASRMTCSAAAGIIAQDCVEDTEAQKQRFSMRQRPCRCFSRKTASTAARGRLVMA